MKRIETMTVGDTGEYINDYVGWDNASRLRVSKIPVEPVVADGYLLTMGRKRDTFVNKGFICVSHYCERRAFLYLHDYQWWLYFVEAKLTSE